MERPFDREDPKRVVAASYDQVAHAYARLEEHAWPRRRWLTRLLEQLHSGAAVLDLGCGSGDPAVLAVACHHQVTGVDSPATQITLARQNVPTGTFLHADAGSVAFPPNTFDAVVCFYTLEHLPRAEHATVLARIAQWLRPNGFFLLSIEAGEYADMIGEWLGVPMFLSCFDPDTTQRLIVAAGLTVLERAIETQTEQGQAVPYLWVLAQKQVREAV